MDIYLNFKNESREAIAFYEKVFETEASGITTYGEMPGIEQMNLPEEAKNEEETKRLFESLAEGGKIEMPLDTVPWAQLYGMVTDRFGINWQINQE